MPRTFQPYEIDADNLSALIRAKFNFAFDGVLPEIKSVAVNVPTEEQFLESSNSRGSLKPEMGKISIISRDASLPPLNLNMPMPVNGVFLFNSIEEDMLWSKHKTSLWTWCPWISEVAGPRVVRGNTYHTKYALRIGSGGPTYGHFPLTNERGNPVTESYFEKHTRIPAILLRRDESGKHITYKKMFCLELVRFLSQLPDILNGKREARLISTILTSPTKKNIQSATQIIRNNADLILKTHKPSDLDDLEHRMLMTYTFWTTSQIIESIWLQLLLDEHKNKKETAEDRWKVLIAKARFIEHRLFPRKELMERGCLELFRPLNPIHAISQLTKLKRYGHYEFSNAFIEGLPAVYHQNHPSYNGRICPVETTESEMVGISLHLAKGATLDEKGVISPCLPSAHGLGWAASLIPFYEHNDAVRNMMGAKNLKQSCPVRNRTRPVVATAEENEITKALNPITQMGLIPELDDHAGNLAPGCDLLVAFMPFKGLNFEDAIVANERLSRDRVLEFVEEEHASYRIRPGLVQSPPKNGPLDTSDDNAGVRGCAKPDAILEHSSILAHFWDRKTGEAQHIRYQELTPAKLLSISLDYHSSFGGRLNVSIAKNYPLQVGDKLMGRHGNKGVIAALLPDDEMPKLPDTDDFPPKLRGRAMDLVLNPHGVISRMNMGQLMETHLGWLKYVLPEQERDKLNFDCRAFAREFPARADELSQYLKDSKLDAQGKIHLTLPGGDETKMPVVIGYQHIVRLRHIPSLKAQSRGRSQEAIYDLRTGQAVRGRRIGGGQRIGEMEMWALAAHQARHILDENLRIKSDYASFKKHDAEHTTTWESIRDHLFAVGISVTPSKPRGVQFDFVPMRTAKWSSGPVTGRNDVIQGNKSVFHCSECNYRPTEKPIFHTANERSTTLNAVFDAMGLVCPSKPDTWKQISTDKRGFRSFEGQWRLTYKDSRQNRKAYVECVEHKTDIAVKMTLQKGKYNEAVVLTAFGRKPGLGGEGKQAKIGFTAASLAGENLSPTLLPIGEMKVTCSHEHAAMPLRPISELGYSCREATHDGIFSPVIFGEAGEHGHDADRWGHIELPEPMDFPAKAFDSELVNPPKIKFVPVLPVKYRMPSMLGRREKSTLPINKKYRYLIDQNRKTIVARDRSGTDSAVYQKEFTKLKYAVCSVFKACLHVIEGSIPKKGLFRRHGLGRRVDCSGRLVIVPDPSLSPSVCKVPVPILWELLSADIVPWLKEAENFFAGNKSGRLTTAAAFDQALKNAAIDQSISTDQASRSFDIRQKALLDSKSAASLHGKNIKPGETEDICYRTLNAYLKQHPEKLILLNRSPTLHKYGILSFRPIPTLLEQGLVLRISPLVCGMYGADFDGDEMSLHWPLTKAAHEDAKRLLPRNNLISEASGKPTLHYVQDIVLGIYLLKKQGSEKVLFELLEKHLKNSNGCKQMLNSHAEWNEETGLQLIQHICNEHPDQAEALIQDVSIVGFNAATSIGISFGIFDLIHLKFDPARIQAILNEMQAALNAKTSPSPGTTNVVKDTDKRIRTEVKEFLTNKTSLGIKDPGFGFASMVASGAKGEKTARQVVAIRGLLDPGPVGFVSSLDRYFFRHNLLDGCDRDQYFETVYNSRSSICDKKLGTAQSGGLTRKLVGLLWDVAITEVDCGVTGERNPINCKTVGGICRKCYNPRKDDLYEIGYPAGLVAAQSIGERGTQLSMQSFHTGEKAFTPHDVAYLTSSPNYYLIEAFFTMPHKRIYSNPDPLLRRLLEPLYVNAPSIKELHNQLLEANEKKAVSILRKLKKTEIDFIPDSEELIRLDHLLGHAFVYLFHSISAYDGLLLRHIQLFWRARHDQIRETKPPLPPLAALAFQPMRPLMLHFAAQGATDSLTHPASLIVTSAWSKE